MRIKFNKELEFLIKKIFFSEKYLLKKRLKRSIKSSYEAELNILHQIVKKDQESVDAGVYRGVYTYELARLSAYVHSFEPNPLIYPYLNKNLQKIVSNMRLYNVALSDETSAADLKIPKRFKTFIEKNYEEKYKLGLASIHKKNIFNNEGYITYKVKTAKLDDVLINNKVGFIKIDVEGHEKNVIMGARNIIQKNKPNMLIEIENRHTQEKVENIINFINAFGYKSYYLNLNKLKSTSYIRDFRIINNYIFIP